jgi:hypothetical protein
MTGPTRSPITGTPHSEVANGQPSGPVSYPPAGLVCPGLGGKLR